jgi:F-type H+-transporting ATPase subunit epsilon
MHLTLLLPTEVLVDEAVTRIVAEADNGFFCLLPRHVDFVAALVPGILYYSNADGEERYAAVDEGTLVKCGDHVRVSVLNGATGTDLDALHALVADSFLDLDDEERRARSALARLEAGAMRRFIEMEQQIHG